MSLKKIGKLPKRIIEDIRIIASAKNWKSILAAKFSKKHLERIELRNGVILNAPKKVDLNFLFHEIWLQKVYSPSGYEIKSKQTVVDIGANIGVFALYAATRASGVLVHSFEPFPTNANFFEKNVKESNIKNIELHKVAVADSSTERTLNITESWLKHTLNEEKSQSEGITVQCISLNDALSSIESCDLLKIDCEGSEYEILYSSSPETIKKIKRIVGEFHNVDNNSKNGDQLLNFLKNNGYKIDLYYPLDPKSGIICARRNN